MGFLSCPLCEHVTIIDLQDLQQKIAKSLSRNLTCPICSSVQQGLTSLHYHLAGHIPIKCPAIPTCNPPSPEQIPSLERLEIRDEAQSRHHQQKVDGVTTMENASYINTNEKILCNREISEKDSVVHHNCDLCGLVFSSEYFLGLHKDIMHCNANGFEVTCKLCQSKFKTVEEYRIHVKEMHSERRYICDRCPKSFKMKGGLLVHNRMYHDNSSPSVCQICHKNFTSKALKELHEKRYHSAKADVNEKNKASSSNTIGEAKNCLVNLISKTSQSTVNCDILPQSPPDQRENASTSTKKTASTSTKESRAFMSNCKNNANSTLNKETSEVLNRDLQTDCSVDLYSPIISERAHQPQGSQVTTAVDRNVQCEPSLGQNKGIKNTSPLAVMSNIGLSLMQPDFQLNSNYLPENVVSQNPETSPSIFHDTTSTLLNNYYTSRPLFSTNANANVFNSLCPDSDTLNVSGKNTASQSANKEVNSILAHPINSQEVIQKAKERESTCGNVETTHPEPSLISGTNSSKLQFSTSQQIANYIISLPSNFNLNPSFSSIAPFLPSSSIPKSDNSVGYTNNNDSNGASNNNATRASEVARNSSPQGKKEDGNKVADPKQWECDICKKSFTTKYFLKKHKRLHTGETPYACEECGKTFAFQQSYHKHVFYHSDDKPHVCSYCGRAFKEMSTLHNHIRIHTGEKPFVCDTCGKAFRQRVSYFVHQRIHTGQMPYRCDSCGKVFRYKVSLRSHKCTGKATDESSNQVHSYPSTSNAPQMPSPPMTNISIAQDHQETVNDKKKDENIVPTNLTEIAQLAAEIATKPSIDGGSPIEVQPSLNKLSDVYRQTPIINNSPQRMSPPTNSHESLFHTPEERKRTAFSNGLYIPYSSNQIDSDLDNEILLNSLFT